MNGWGDRFEIVGWVFFIRNNLNLVIRVYIGFNFIELRKIIIVVIISWIGVDI